jgi:Ran GTPase-activating protein (RanGAP) involved in mRNA processing and transport
MKCLPQCGLRELYLQRNQIGDKGLQSLSKYFGYLHPNKVQYLDLTCNKITKSGLYQLFSFLCDNSSIETLVLDQNNFHGKLSSNTGDQKKNLSQFIGETKSLKKLYMNKCEMDEDAGVAFQNGLRKNATITHLYIAHNNLYDDGCNSICEALYQNHRLQVLDLSDNRIREKGGINLGAVLKHNQTIKELYLRGNTLTDNAASAIYDALQTNKKLKKLNLVFFFETKNFR